MAKKGKKEEKGPTSHTSERYDTAEEAAAAAAAIFNPFSIESDREVGGGIIQDADTKKFFFTFTVGGAGEGEVQMRIRKRKKDQLVGLWHSHGAPKEGGGRDGRNMFSEGDVDQANRFGVPSYIVTHKGQLLQLPVGSKSKRIKVGGAAIPRKGNFGRPVTDASGNPVRLRTSRTEALGNLQRPSTQSELPADD